MDESLKAVHLTLFVKLENWIIPVSFTLWVILLNNRSLSQFSIPGSMNIFNGIKQNIKEKEIAEYITHSKSMCLCLCALAGDKLCF